MREDERLSPALWGVLTLLFLALFINYIDRGALSIAAPIIKEQFGMSPGKLGVLLSAFFWTYASFLLISGWLADRFDAGYVLAAGFFKSAGAVFSGASSRLCECVHQRGDCGGACVRIAAGGAADGAVRLETVFYRAGLRRTAVAAVVAREDATEGGYRWRD